MKSRRLRVVLLSCTLLAAALVSLRVVVNRKDGDGWTALHRAAEVGDLSAMRLLIFCGADVNAQSIPLDYATATTDRITPGLFETSYKRSVSTPLNAALAKGQIPAAAMLIDHGARLSAGGQYGMTPLHFAAASGSTESVALLLDKGAEVGPTDRNGWTALHWAAEAGHVESVKLLLEHGAEPNARSTRSWKMPTPGHFNHPQYESRITPLHVAAQGPNLEMGPKLSPKPASIAVTEALLAGGADLDARDARGATPLDYAEQTWATTELYELLLRARDSQRAGG